MDDYENNQFNSPTENLYSFSAYLGDKFKVSSHMLCNHLFCSISLALSTTEKIRNDINEIYLKDRWTYYQKAKSSECMKHPIMSQGRIDNELYAYKALGILLVAETQPEIRSNVIRLIREHYAWIYKFMKKHEEKYLKPLYRDIPDFLTNPKANFDRVIYFYLSFYCTPEWVNQNLLNEITQTIYNYEQYSPIFADIPTEINTERQSIDLLHEKITEKYGNLTNYLPILEHPDPKIYSVGNVIENLFHINKLNLDDIYADYQSISLDEIYLSILKQKEYSFSANQLIYVIVFNIFLQPLISEYKRAKQLISQENQENLTHQLSSANQTIKDLQDENELLLAKVTKLEDDYKKLMFEKETSQIEHNKKITSEVAGLNKDIRELSKELEDEKKYHQELNKLREFIFNLDMPLSPLKSNTISLKDAITDKKIIIIGGPRSWRRKLRENLPEIVTLSGTNSSLDLANLNQMDCVLFYTNYMSHAIYNKAMNYIRANQITFGYIKTTNMMLLEAEIHDVLKQCRVI